MDSINITDLQNLNQAYHSINSSIHFIYGANRSGKTTFMRDFIIKKNHIYFNCIQTSKSILYPSLANIISQKFKQKNSLNFFKDFKDILDLINEREVSGKLAIIFDDFQEIFKIDKDALEILLNYWEKKLKHKHLQIIVLSASKFDVKNEKKIHKYHKNNFLMKKMPFSNLDKIKNIDEIDKLYIYSFFGSSHNFLKYYNPQNEFIKNVYKMTLEVNSPFLTYGFTYLKKDISDISTYCSILYAVSKGNNKIGQIASFINLKSTDLTRYIKRLQDLFIIKKVLPLDDNFKNSKYGRYYIMDNFLKLWFCYIFDNLSSLQMKKQNRVLKLINDNFIRDLISPSYKDFILDLINENPQKYLGFMPLKIGKWWDNSNEIDIIAYDDTQISFISVLWDNADVAKMHYGLLKNISDNYKTSLKRNYIIISKNTYVNYKKELNG